MNITVIGGGTGTTSVLKGLKKIPDLNISVIVTMMDDGGSQKIVRKVFGLLPVSDIRKSLLALSQCEDKEIEKIFAYRFSKGKNLKSHTVGNLIMIALAQIVKSEEKAIEEIEDILNTKGKVIPVTKQMCKLVAEYTGGKTRKGEHEIDEPKDYKSEKILHIYTKPKVKANTKAIQAIKRADVLIAGPGDLYTTTIPNFLVEGIAEAIRKNKGMYVYISNLMTKKGQTRNLTAGGLINEIERYSKRKPDFVLINSGKIEKSILKKYEKFGDFPIVDDLEEKESYKVIRDDIIKDEEIEKEKGDNLFRSLVRHDEKKLAKILERIFYEKSF